MAKGCRKSTEQGTNLKPVMGKQHSFQMEPTFEPNEKIQLSYAEPIPDESNSDAYIDVAVIDEWSKCSTAKIVSSTMADNAIKCMQRYTSDNGVSCKLRCDQAQTTRPKKA